MILAAASTTQQATTNFTFDDVLAPYIYVFMAAFLVSFLFTPLMRRVASHYGIVDKPDGNRKIHREPVAYLGGVAVFLGWLVGLASSQRVTVHGENLMVGPHLLHPHVPFPLVLGAILIVLVGLVDDVKGVRPWQKILGQVIAAGLLIWGGIGRGVTKWVIVSVDERLQLLVNHVRVDHLMYIPEWTILVSSVALTVAIVVFCCNAANLMDGLDGLCGGVTAIIAAGYVFLALHIATGGDGNTANLDGTRVVIALALLGGVLGFVPYNFNPASIFMGDAGSMFLGFAAAVMMLMMGEVQSKWLLAAIVMFALPILDTSLAFVRRYVNKRPFFSADKHHIHHQFLNRGLSVKQTVLFLYASAIIFVLLGAGIAETRTRYAVAIYLVLFGCIVVAAFKMGMVHEKAFVFEKKDLKRRASDKLPPPAGAGAIEVAGEGTTGNAPIEPGASPSPAPLAQAN